MGKNQGRFIDLSLNVSGEEQIELIGRLYKMEEKKINHDK